MSTYALPEIRPKPEDTDPSLAARREYYKDLNYWCDSAKEEGEAIQQDIPELRDIQGALDYLVGMQWKDAMPSYRAKPVSNEFLTMFWETVGLLTDIRPMFNIVDLSVDGGYSEQAHVLNRLAKGWASSNKFERTFGFCIMFGMMTSAPCKVFWDPFANGVSGDPWDYQVTMRQCSPSSILRLGSTQFDIQQDECVIWKHVETLDWIKRAYQRMGKYVVAEPEKSKYTVDVQAPGGVSPQFYPPLSPGMKRLLGVNEKDMIESVYPSATVEEFWRNDDMINEARTTVWVGPENSPWGYKVEPGKKMYPRGRVFVRANGVILYDQPNPYFHRKKPFAVLNLYGVPWQQYAMSVVAPWMKQQDILNQMMSGILQTVKKAVNPALMASKAAINPVAMKAIDSSKPGLKVSYSQNAPTPPVWQQPPNLPTYVLQSYSMILQSMKQNSGAAAAGDAMGKKQVPAGDSLDKITFAKNTPIRLMSRNSETFLDDVGYLWTAETLQFCDAGHRMQLLGPTGLVKEDIDAKPGVMIPDDIDGEDFVRKFHFQTKRGSLLKAQQQEEIQITFAMRKGHDISRHQMFKKLDWNIDEAANDKELAEEAKAMAQAQAAAGVKPGGKGKK
jgi:hypothetical protein